MTRLHTLQPAWFDTHAHLGDELLWSDRSAVLEGAKQIGMGAICNICTDSETLKRGISIRKTCSDVYLSAATGPNELLDQDFFLKEVEQSALEGHLHAVGEIGLDKHWQQVEISRQIEGFIAYLDLARKVNLPVIIHCRLAFKEVIEVLDKHYLGKEGALPGVFHCFAEGVDEMREVVSRGWFVSFGGIVTYRSAKEVQAAAKEVDASHFVLETDSPYLAPHPKRNRRNEPKFCIEVAEKVAELREEELLLIKSQSWENACRLFQLA